MPSGTQHYVRAEHGLCSRPSARNYRIDLPKPFLRSTISTPSLPLAQLGRSERRRLIDTLVRGPLPWTGDEGYKKAEVTGGGVSLADIDPATMESRRHRGLFLCGEMLDAFGPIGGYNFLWAWATGRAAGIGAVKTRCAMTAVFADAMLDGLCR